MSAISLVLFNKNRLQKLILPQKIEGSFWLVDELNNNANIINIEAIDNNWVMKNNDDTKDQAAFISLPDIMFIISLFLLIGSGIILFLMK